MDCINLVKEKRPCQPARIDYRAEAMVLKLLQVTMLDGCGESGGGQVWEGDSDWLNVHCPELINVNLVSPTLPHRGGLLLSGFASYPPCSPSILFVDDGTAASC